ncbi:MAG: sensor histidine kinase [Candidatus Dormibacteraceae bacterium]
MDARLTSHPPALAVWWTILVGAAGAVLLSRPLSQAARRLAKRRVGGPLAVEYPRPAQLVQMATGHWWNGYAYHKDAGSARREAWIRARAGGPQWRRDLRWLLLAAVAVFPLTALPVLGLAGAVYATFLGAWGWAILLLLAALVAAPFAWWVFPPLAPRFLGPPSRSPIDQRVEQLLSTRADLTQTQAAELERIERGLHDGAQARLVALGMTLGAAERLVDTDPEGARRILREGRSSSAAALAELRTLVRGINPPVLTERGLVDAVRALALAAPLEVEVCGCIPSRPERPIESALYFTVAELLANVVKQAPATQATIEFGYGAGALLVTVLDDGVGGAAGSEGGGLQGIERRLAAFDGRLHVTSPAGGGTRVDVAVPCVLS